MRPAAVLGAALILLVGCNSATPSPSVSLASCPTAAPTAAQAETINADAGRVAVATSLGTFTIELYPEAAPIATANFVALAGCGFYNQITFHRVIAGFVIQAGDPQTRLQRGSFAGLGTGGPGYFFGIEPVAAGLQYDPYVVAMANASSPDTNGSQFFIDLASLVGQLAPNYTIFGKVIEGTAVIDAIGAVAVNEPTIGVPLTAVIIESMTISP
ncbi:MAG TPA: peptidylprolyl isomerase [Candidatus Limnocylindria bacterium]|nr:peptidylprolyl isomerase [Candidatus Limnocylindria bacterium]